MRLSKEQAEMLAVAVLAGCALIIVSFIYLVKPEWAAAAKAKSDLSKMEEDIAKVSRAHKNLANAAKEKRNLIETIEQGEKTVFAGLEAGFPLNQIFAKAAALVGVKPAYAEQTTRELLSFSEKTPGGTQTTRHYDEVSRMLEMRSVDFFSLCDFLGAVEQANEGLRVSGLRIEAASVEPSLKSQGTVNANVELTLLGIRQGEPPDTSTLVVRVPENPDVAGTRNPFGPRQERRQAVHDPLASGRAALKKIKVNAIIGEWLLLEVPAKTPTEQKQTEQLNLKKGQTAVIGELQLKYLGTLGDSLVFVAVAHDVRFMIEADHKGEVTTIREEAMK